MLTDEDRPTFTKLGMSGQLNNIRKCLNILRRHEFPLLVAREERDPPGIRVSVPGAFTICLYHFRKSLEYFDNLSAGPPAARVCNGEAARGAVNEIAHAPDFFA